VPDSTPFNTIIYIDQENLHLTTKGVRAWGVRGKCLDIVVSNPHVGV
jgi:hypothetical protein